MASIKKYEDFVHDFNVDLKSELQTDIPTFGEYRKGSEQYGGLVTKMMEWLRLKRENSKDELTNLSVSFDIFSTESGIQIKDLENFIKDKISKGLYNFEIKIDYPNKTIIFDNLIKRDSKILTEN